MTTGTETQGSQSRGFQGRSVIQWNSKQIVGICSQEGIGSFQRIIEIHQESKRSKKINSLALM